MMQRPAICQVLDDERTRADYDTKECGRSAQVRRSLDNLPVFVILYCSIDAFRAMQPFGFTPTRSLASNYQFPVVCPFSSCMSSNVFS
jgi:hypothetical protein